MTVLLLTRGKEVIVEWLLGQLEWVVAAVVVGCGYLGWREGERLFMIRILKSEILNSI